MSEDYFAENYEQADVLIKAEDVSLRILHKIFWGNIAFGHLESS